MHVIPKRRLREFWATRPDAQRPLERWHTILSKSAFTGFADLRKVFGDADWVDGRIVFDIGGNKYRLAVDIAFKFQVVYVKAVMTHADYDKGRWKR